MHVQTLPVTPFSLSLGVPLPTMLRGAASSRRTLTTWGMRPFPFPKWQTARGMPRSLWWLEKQDRGKGACPQFTRLQQHALRLDKDCPSTLNTNALVQPLLCLDSECPGQRLPQYTLFLQGLGCVRALQVLNMNALVQLVLCLDNECPGQRWPSDIIRSTTRDTSKNNNNKILGKATCTLVW